MSRTTYENFLPVLRVPNIYSFEALKSWDDIKRTIWSSSPVSLDSQWDHLVQTKDAKFIVDDPHHTPRGVVEIVYTSTKELRKLLDLKPRQLASRQIQSFPLTWLQPRVGCIPSFKDQNGEHTTELLTGDINANSEDVQRAPHTVDEQVANTPSVSLSPDVEASHPSAGAPAIPESVSGMVQEEERRVMEEIPGTLVATPPSASTADDKGGLGER